MIISSTFILWTFVSKQIANQKFIVELNKQEINYDKLLVSPTPLNSALWHCIVKTKNGYYFATSSIFDKSDNIKFHYEESNNEVLDDIKKNRLIGYYLNYTQDYPLVKKVSIGNIKIYAVKFGPINYLEKPKFVYPICFNQNDLSDENIKIEKPDNFAGPFSN